jgi:osmotically-inducible protein OsmY
MKTDIQLQKDILDELAWDPAINATDVGVIVKDGVVTLTGHLTNYAEKYAAERAARRVSGVKALAVEIEVRLSPSYKRSDTDIAAAVKRAIDGNVAIPANCIQPMVEDGWITLSGEVEWDYQRKAAERSVRDLFGVVSVTNLVKIKPKVAPSDVEKSIHDALVRQAEQEAEKGIHDALLRQAEQEAKQLQILVNGSRVTLRGKVHSWTELRAVQAAAWAAPGVETVVNELKVET